MTRLLKNLFSRRAHKHDDRMNSNGVRRGPSEADLQVLAEEARRFEHDFRELAKS